MTGKRLPADEEGSEVATTPEPEQEPEPRCQPPLL